MQLVAYGAQDVYLTGNPQITFWKVTYRRHTNFAMESIEQTFNGQADFGRRVTCTISRNGDLAYRTYLQVTLPEINQHMLGTLPPGAQDVHPHAQGSSSKSIFTIIREHLHLADPVLRWYCLKNRLVISSAHDLYPTAVNQCLDLI